MGVPGFYSWLTRRYPMIKQMINKESIPQIDYLYLDMNGIIYRCVRDDSIIFKSQLMPKELEEMWIEIFNYINEIVDMLKPTKMIIMALDGVAPRCKMNNQRSRRFRSAQDYKEYIERLYGYTDIVDSQQNFKNNSISPGTSFMEQLNEMLHFFIQKKIEEDNSWKTLSVIFTGSDTPGEGEHKIMEFVRSNQENFLPQDTHCFYGADADLIMLGLTLPVKNACIIREEYIHTSEKVHLMSTRKEKQINFQLIYLTVLKECFDLEYQPLKSVMQIEYNIDKIARDFVFLFFFIGNDFLPRIYAYNIREKSIEKLIQGFKEYLTTCLAYITDGPQLNLVQLLRLLGDVGKYEADFFADKQLQFQKLQNREQKNFQDELQKIFLAKIKHQSQTLLGLKQMYSNLDGSGKINYYNTYFQIDPQNQAEQLWNILAYYVYGLKFVYEYYFKNLASWSWYYPYYFAPLLTDIQYYLGHLIAQGQTLSPFQLDKPFEPFKQLLCILPKESCDLLPQNYRKYLLDANSQLRNPVDFYPDVVNSVNYGSIRAHEAIYLIPFLDQSIVCQAYEREIENTSESEKTRNILRPSRLYEYDISNEKREVKSPFPSISNFQSKSKMKDVSLLEKFDWKTAKYVHPVNEGEEKLLKMPSLNMRPFELAPLPDNCKYFDFKLILKEEQKQNFKIGEQIYYGYPLEHSGRIEAILTPKLFYYTSEVNLNKYEFLRTIHPDFTSPKIIKDYPNDLFNIIKKDIAFSKAKSHGFYNFIDLSKTKTFLFLVETKTFSRTIQGQFQRHFKDNHNQSFAIIPACVASKQKHYQTTKANYKFKKLQDQFQTGEEVLLTHWQPHLCGAKGKVVGYTQDHKKVRVQILEEPRYINQKLKAIIDTLSTKTDLYFTLKFAAAILQIKFDHLESFLGNINVNTPRDSKLPPSIDIGLNLMSRRERKIVPNLVRINFHHKDHRETQLIAQNPFRHIEISVRALQILIEYKQKFPQIFTFITKRHVRLIERSSGKIDWDQPIYAQSIYPQNSAKSIMRIYKWLVQMQETHIPASSLYSKQVNLKRIQKLQDLFLVFRAKKEEENKRMSHKKQKESKIQHVDPNFLFSHRLSQLGYLYLKKKPKNHSIGDLVICVSPQFFGHYGAIIGIDDNKYEVFFDEPSFGKSDLVGLCDNLWGGKFDFRQLLNLTTWPQLFTERIKGGGLPQKLGWNDSIEQYYPAYQSKPFKDFVDIQGFTAKEENKKYFTPELLQYIFSVQKNLKQTNIDDDYMIVDNKKEDYRYKYAKPTSYIEKKQIDEAAELMKTMEQTSQNLLYEEPAKIKENEIFKEVEKEIIENKVSEEAKNEGEIGQEEDAEDILG